MRVWLYGRLSNDDDAEMDSLLNQMNIVRSFCDKRGFRIVGESFDDNVSGMRFDRDGLNQIKNAVESGQIDAVVVKDLSRLGRHQIQTALFIDDLRQHGVAVLSVTENLNTLRDDDDLIIGLRGLMNDFYAKDIANKIRNGYRQKQKTGLVITPPFGYWKDRNTGQILLHPETSITVRMIYSWYAAGIGQREIVRRLNRLGYKTPIQMKDARCGKQRKERYLWTNKSVKNILRDECYTGVLINHMTDTKNGKATPVSSENQYRHECFYPAVVSSEEWEQIQKKLNEQSSPTPGNKPKHRYAGLLLCGECKSPFVPIIRRWRGNQRVEYICREYQLHGKNYCTSHRIHEEVLDANVQRIAENLRYDLKKQQAQLNEIEKLWALRKPILNAHIASLQIEIKRLEEEIETILMEKIRG